MQFVPNFYLEDNELSSRTDLEAKKRRSEIWCYENCSQCNEEATMSMTGIAEIAKLTHSYAIMQPCDHSYVRDVREEEACE